MAKRPKSVSFVAIFFAIMAVYFAGLSKVRIAPLRTYPQIFYICWSLSLQVWAVFLLANAAGLWLLYKRARVSAIWLSGYLAICYFVVNMARAKMFTRLSSLPVEAGAAEVLGMLTYLLWFLVPIYILTRPKIVNMFERSDEAKPN